MAREQQAMHLYDPVDPFGDWARHARFGQHGGVAGPEVPGWWHHACDWVDEIWAFSRYTYGVSCRSAPVPVPVPVWHMPLAVVAQESARIGREATSQRSAILPAR